MTKFKKLGNVCRAQHFGRMLSLSQDSGRGNIFNIDCILTHTVSCLRILATNIQLYCHHRDIVSVEIKVQADQW